MKSLLESIGYVFTILIIVQFEGGSTSIKTITSIAFIISVSILFTTEAVKLKTIDWFRQKKNR